MLRAWSSRRNPGRRAVRRAQGDHPGICTDMATPVVSLDGTGITLTGDGPDLIALASKPASEEIGNDDTRDMGLQRPDENHLGQLAPALVPAVRPVLLPVQGHVPMVDLVADHGQRPVDRLPPVQPCHRAAPLPSQRVGARMTARVVCHPSGTRRAVPKPSVTADHMKRLDKSGPARIRQTDR